MSFWLVFIILLITGVVGGLLSSITGLASLVTYPVLLAVGVPPVLANMTNTAAMIFTGVGSTVASLKELRGHGSQLIKFILIDILGGATGGILLLIFPSSTFEKIVPFFIFFAGLMLLLSLRKKTDQTIERDLKSESKSTLTKILGLVGLYLVSIYTGYFGAAGGVITLALLTVILNERYLVINAYKNLLSFVGNVVATIIFAVKATIDWTFVVPLGLGLLIGGYSGPILMRRMNIRLLRIVISFGAFGLAIYLFYTAYLQ